MFDSSRIGAPILLLLVVTAVLLQGCLPKGITSKNTRHAQVPIEGTYIITYMSKSAVVGTEKLAINPGGIYEQTFVDSKGKSQTTHGSWYTNSRHGGGDEIVLEGYIMYINLFEDKLLSPPVEIIERAPMRVINGKRAIIIDEDRMLYFIRK